MKVTCTTQHGEQINGTINKKTGITQKAQGLYFYHFIQEHTRQDAKKAISGRIGFDKNTNNMRSFQFKNNNSTEIFQLLDNITVDRCEGLCNEIRGEKQAIVLY